MTTPSPFPLAWPAGLQRTTRRVSSPFRTSLSGALKNVRTSLQMFAKDSNLPVTDIVLSSDVGGGLEPGPVTDPGVAAWFKWDGEQRCIAVDRYPKVEDNLQAIHHVIEARRTEMRHGGLHIIRQTFKGFIALPSPTSFRIVLSLSPGAYTADDVQRCYRAAAKAATNDTELTTVNLARDEALAAIGAK